MTTTTFDPTTDIPSDEQAAAETAALAQGEKLVQAEQEDKLRQFEKNESENEDVSLIGGKFKSQDDLLKAYEELQSKMGSKESTEEDEDTVAEEIQPQKEEEADEVVDYMFQLNDQYEKDGKLSDDAIEKLSNMDSKELIASYLKYNAKASSQYQQATLAAEAINEIKASVGGDAEYTAMTTWAAENLSEAEIGDYNTVTNSGNPIAIKFAVEALANRYRGAEGYEAPLVTGKKASASGLKPYRSQAELARDISNPLYSSDPAFRQDVEERLSKSTDLL